MARTLFQIKDEETLIESRTGDRDLRIDALLERCESSVAAIVPYWGDVSDEEKRQVLAMLPLEAMLIGAAMRVPGRPAFDDALFVGGLDQVAANQIAAGLQVSEFVLLGKGAKAQLVRVMDRFGAELPD